MFRAPAALLIAAALGVSACTPIRGHQGYVVDVDLINSVQPGIDNRDTVLKVLGKPTVAGQFTDTDWYYISRDTRNFAFNNPKAKTQIALKVSFDKNGVVTGINRTGIEQIASISPYGKTTPTLGRERGFFEDLFGNIGTVGAAGAGAPGGGNGGP